jgi:MSHA biogenesis protein MshI
VARVSHPLSNAPSHIDLCHFQADDGVSAHPETIRALTRQDHLDNATCISVAETGSYTLLLVEAPEVDPTELKAAVRWRIKDLIDFHIDDAVIDVFDIPNQEQRGRQKMMYVVASRITSVQQHIDLLEDCDVNLSVIDIPELAMRNIAALLPEDKNGVALLHFSPQGTFLTLTRQETFYLSRSREYSSHQLALDAAAGGTTSDEAGLTLEPVDESGISLALQQHLDTIILETQRSMDYYESHFSLPPISGLVIAPTEEPVPGMLAYLANNLGLPVRMLDLNTVLDIDVPLSDALQAQCLLAIGAALRQEERAL